MSNEDQAENNQEPGQPIIDDAVKKNVRSRNTWLRLFYMLVFALLMGLAEFVLVFVVIVQFLTVLLSGQRNERLLEFGADTSRYVYDIWRYLCFVSEEQPFPFGEWRAASDTQSKTEEPGS